MLRHVRNNIVSVIILQSLVHRPYRPSAMHACICNFAWLYLFFIASCTVTFQTLTFIFQWKCCVLPKLGASSCCHFYYALNRIFDLKLNIGFSNICRRLLNVWKTLTQCLHVNVCWTISKRLCVYCIKRPVNVRWTLISKRLMHVRLTDILN